MPETPLPPLSADCWTVEESSYIHTTNHSRHPLPVCSNWTIHIQGNVAEVKRHFPTDVDRDIPPRGMCGPMNQESRMRMLKLMNRIDWKRINFTLFVTLTYPDHVNAYPFKTRALHRQLFVRKLETLLGREISVIWRVEWKIRKTGQHTGKYYPHWHLLVLSVSWIKKEWVRESWRQIIHSGEGPLCTDVKLVRGHEGAIKYVAKYLAKQTALDITANHNIQFEYGHSWGVTRRTNIPMCPVSLEKTLTLCEIQAAKLYAVRVKARYSAAIGGGFTRLGKEEADFLLSIFGCHLTPPAE